MPTNNSCDYSPVIYNVLTGAASGEINNVAPAASSIPLVSGGASAQPSFGTAGVVGGGTGAVSFTAYAPVCGGTTITSPLQVASIGQSTTGFVLTSNGLSVLPSFQAIPASSSTSTTYEGATPYYVLATDDKILVDTATIAGPSTMILLPAPTVDGKVWTIKDWSGSAGLYPITINGNGHLIDGASTLVLNNNYEAVSICWDNGNSTYSAVYDYVSPSAGSSLALNVQTFMTAGSFTYTPTSGMKYATIQVIGGGGGGGAAQACVGVQSAAGSGGGGAGYSSYTASAAYVGAGLAVVVGAGGAGGIYGTSQPGTGGNSSVGATAAGGGDAGINGIATSTALFTPGGPGGSGFSGDYLVGGGAGYGALALGSLVINSGGEGGNCIWGGSCEAVTINNVGNNGNYYGGGGGGASVSGTSATKNGGAGAPGLVVITEYI